MISLVAIETTPNPNSMKLNLNDAVGETRTYTLQDSSTTPDWIQALLHIDGIASIFATGDFLTLNRDPRMDWQPILAEARRIFSGEQVETNTEDQRLAAEKEGQVQVWVQTFRQIPIQVKVTDGVHEERISLSERFGLTAKELQQHFAADYLKERYWADGGVRYGTLTEIAQEVAEEIEGVWHDDKLTREKQLAFGTTHVSDAISLSETQKLIRNGLQSSDWQERFQAIQQLTASEENLPALIQGLRDEKSQIRRWAAAKLAGLKTPASVAVLCDALLHDSNIGVRRTAGDSLSDIGDVSAQPAVCQALEDNNKLVRWRAARFLAEVGTKEALPSLKKAENDPEYEVRLEVSAAIQHIQEGSKAALPAWKLMAQENPGSLP